MERASFIPPQIHTFCMETEEADVAYVASRLFYAAVAAGQEVESPDTVDRQKYVNLAKVLIPTLSIRRPSPIAEGQVCKALGSHPPVPSNDVFKPAMYADVPTMENPQVNNDAAELAQQAEKAVAVAPASVNKTTASSEVVTADKKETPSTTEGTEKSSPSDGDTASHLD